MDRLNNLQSLTKDMTLSDDNIAQKLSEQYSYFGDSDSDHESEHSELSEQEQQEIERRKTMQSRSSEIKTNLIKLSTENTWNRALSDMESDMKLQLNTLESLTKV
eukprot:382399_1